MNLRAEASEQDIAYGRVIKGSTFKKDFETWQKKKRIDMNATTSSEDVIDFFPSEKDSNKIKSRNR